MRPHCDEAVIRSAGVGVMCRAEVGLWILAPTILGSSLAFVDSTIVNVVVPEGESGDPDALAGSRHVAG